MSYLINETTEEERKLLAEKALSISLSNATEPSDYTLSLIQEYINGNMELDEIQKIIIKKYKENKEGKLQ